MSDTAREEAMATTEQAQVGETAPEAASEVVNTVVEEGASVAPPRSFTVPGRDPFEEIEWELRHAHIPGMKSMKCVQDILLIKPAIKMNTYLSIKKT
jgi:hypothetical protein